jgi:hypothetical protein
MGMLRQIFGPSRDEIWQQLALELGAKYQQDFWTGARVEVAYGEWTITLDCYAVNTGKSTHHYTRFRAPYVNADGFQFGVYRRNIFHGIADWFGMQDVEVGHKEFDEAFIIQGNDEKKLRTFFANQDIRRLIEAQPQISFSVRGDQGWFSRIHPEGVDELYFQVGGVVKDINRLREVFALFGLVLDQLCEMGSAYEKNPQTKV